MSAEYNILGTLEDEQANLRQWLLNVHGLEQSDKHTIVNFAFLLQITI